MTLYNNFEDHPLKLHNILQPPYAYVIAIVHTAQCNNIPENTKRQHQTKENSQSSIQSFHVPVQAACITTVIPTVALADCNANGQRYVTLAKTTPLPAYNAYNKLPTPLPLLSVI